MNLTSKKGQLIGETTALIVTTILVGILLIILFLSIRAFGTPAAKNIESLNQFNVNNQEMLSLKSYLSTPVNMTYNGENINLSIVDLIRLSDRNSSYVESLQKNTHDIFDRVYGDKYGIDIEGSSALMIFPPVNSAYVSCESISIPSNLKITLCLK